MKPKLIGILLLAVVVLAAGGYSFTGKMAE